jgi:uncharacterized protein
MRKTFLEAEWRKLAMANYAVDPKLLERYLPYKTELDIWRNTCYVSLVGFMFLNTRLKGFRIPFHANFEEVNLRFYVRFNENGEWKRGVVFIKEIVPKPALTFVANRVYKEKYETMAMSHAWKVDQESLLVQYNWKKGDWNSFQVKASNAERDIGSDSEEEFITEHFWGYTFVNQNRTSEYGVEHPRWKVYNVNEHRVDVDFQHVYGNDFGFLIKEKPRSVFLAEGSTIVVREGRHI